MRFIALLSLILMSLPVLGMPGQYAMVFFYLSSCPDCHRFAPKLQRLTQAYALPTYAFSLDGRPLPDYPVPIPVTPDISQQFFPNPRNIVVPATFLINVNTRKYVRVSVGNVEYDALAHSVQNILSDPGVLRAME
ncbi:Type-F conjugative transfer system pilin assembly thiol-disulfide isomerase TrbB [Vibrio nigripulchritudo SOn1]|uniref:Type-F conjugative transfer system pilin assembly thiol-disulfide isomerase TrbB n=1 Tax=Vibrio nigripulchritudo SOn1 TaxID=1238450 RepID=A0AAV2VZS2_9VIBR|nr:type-F conjugative transfer system pilin assembly thiol-disulfide isomerase TrbB [Vibrio nigripulchritudo]CCO50264.1 Type-F conjugative transfer system pilin assembly thiol-disulfide isomerase TrbB [Vibrio nigripulchritudo SOn1]